MKKRFLLPPGARKGFNKAFEKGKKAFHKAGEYVKENYNPKDPFFVKDPVRGRHINNLYTGYKLGGKGNLLVAGSILGGGTVMAANPTAIQNSIARKEIVDSQAEMLDVESLPGTRADHLGYQNPNPPSHMYASGDLVFALHKTSHTGQL